MQPSPFKRPTKQPLDSSRIIPQSRTSSAWNAPSKETTTNPSSSSSIVPSSFMLDQRMKDNMPEAAHYRKSAMGRSLGGEDGERSGGRGGNEHHQKAVDTNKEFERLMDELQIPPSVRLKVSPLDTPMKESLLISFRAQAASQRPSSAYGNGSPGKTGHGRAMSSHPGQMYASGGGGGSPVKRGIGMEHVGAVGMGLGSPTTPDAKGGRHLRKAQSSSTLRSPSGSQMYQSASQPIPHPTPRSGRTSPETHTVDNSKFIMLSTAHSPSKSSFFGGKSSTPVPPPMTKRYTIDGLQLPPCLPGDEDLYASQSNTSGDSGSKGSSSKTKPKSRGRGFSFGAGSASLNPDGSSNGKRSSWFGSRSRDASSNGHIEAITFPVSSSGTGSLSDTCPTNEKHSRTRPRAKARGSQSQDVSAVGAGTSSSGASTSKKWTPAQWAGWLKLEDTFKMGVERAKTLRMLLRHESTEWVEAFLMAGGYEFILRRLDDLLEVEWRTEQHDDKLLYELLRCVKALSTLEVGKQALVAHGSSPFRQLADLLYSEKKPGDLATRQVILELFHSVLSLRPSVSALTGTSPNGSMGPPSLSHTSSSSNTSEQSVPALRNRSSYINMKPVSPEDTSTRGTVLVLDLLRATEDSAGASKAKTGDVRGGLPFLEPASELPAPKLEVHDFLAKVHTEKPYKTYLRELSDVCRDYYWIMCHGENNIWLLSDVDKRSIKPQAPSGATGGVEFEAVYYMTSHFRLLNSLARALAQQDMLDPEVRADRKRGEAWKLHTEMFASGMDRILATIRKASVDFYTEFHLELAIYIQLARESGVRLPYVIEKLLGPPAEKFRKFDAFPGDTSNGRAGGQPQREWLPPARSSSGFDVRAC